MWRCPACMDRAPTKTRRAPRPSQTSAVSLYMFEGTISRALLTFLPRTRRRRFFFYVARGDLCIATLHLLVAGPHPSASDILLLDSDACYGNTGYTLGCPHSYRQISRWPLELFRNRPRRQTRPPAHPHARPTLQSTSPTHSSP